MCVLVSSKWHNWKATSDVITNYKVFSRLCDAYG